MTDQELILILHEASLDPREVNSIQDQDWLEKKTTSLMIALGAVLERLKRSKVTVTLMTYEKSRLTLNPKDLDVQTEETP